MLFNMVSLIFGEKMNKKDRIALVISISWLLILGMLTLNAPGAAEILLTLVPVSVYWGYRFIKNDISFLNNEN